MFSSNKIHVIILLIILSLKFAQSIKKDRNIRLENANSRHKRAADFFQDIFSNIGIGKKSSSSSEATDDQEANPVGDAKANPVGDAQANPVGDAMKGLMKIWKGAIPPSMLCKGVSSVKGNATGLWFKMPKKEGQSSGHGHHHGHGHGHSDGKDTNEHGNPCILRKEEGQEAVVIPNLHYKGQICSKDDTGVFLYCELPLSDNPDDYNMDEKTRKLAKMVQQYRHPIKRLSDGFDGAVKEQIWTNWETIITGNVFDQGEIIPSSVLCAKLSPICDGPDKDGDGEPDGVQVVPFVNFCQPCTKDKDEKEDDDE